MIERIPSQGVSYSARTAAIDKVETLIDNKFSNANQNQGPVIKKDEQKKEKIDEIVNGLNEFLQPSQTSLKFKLHDKLNEYYVTIVDDRTQEVVKEIPSKKLLDIYAAMTDFLGLVVDKKI